MRYLSSDKLLMPALVSRTTGMGRPL